MLLYWSTQTWRVVPVSSGWVPRGPNLWGDPEHPPVRVARRPGSRQRPAGGNGWRSRAIAPPGRGRGAGAHREDPADPHQASRWPHPPPSVRSPEVATPSLLQMRSKLTPRLPPLTVTRTYLWDHWPSHTLTCEITGCHTLTCEITGSHTHLPVRSPASQICNHKLPHIHVHYQVSFTTLYTSIGSFTWSPFG